MTQKPIVFLDRDGTLNKEAGYINHLDNFEMYPFVFQGLRMLNVFGVYSVVVTNQAGVARGYFSEHFLNKVHAKMTNLIEKNGAFIDGIYYCPHHKTAGKGKYAVDCDCRKPKTGLIEQALNDLKRTVDTNKMYVVGDKFSDIYMGNNAGCKSILVKTGYGKGELERSDVTVPIAVTENFLTAVIWILNDLNLIDF